MLTGSELDQHCACKFLPCRPASYDDVIKWKHFPRYWPFVRGIHRSPVNSPHKGQWRGALMFSLICVWINGWVNNGKTGDWKRYRTHYVVIVMFGAWEVDYIYYVMQDVITDLCSNKNGGLTKPWLTLGHGWVTTSNRFMWMQLSIPAPISVSSSVSNKIHRLFTHCFKGSMKFLSAHVYRCQLTFSVNNVMIWHN